MNNGCEHKMLTLKEVPLSDGRPSYREMCMFCEENMPWFVPMIADRDVPIRSYKYAGKTIGQVMDIDKDYVRWLMADSNASVRIKHAAKRVYLGIPFTPKSIGAVYPWGDRYVI